MQDFQLHSLTLTTENISKVFLPKLLGRVFHFTTSIGWKHIQTCRYIDSNKSGKHGNTSIHSKESLGRHLGAVCLFDLRGKGEEVLDKNLIFYDYFNRRWGPEPSYFLFLADQYLSQVTTLSEIDKSLKEQTMYIPNLESWHLGDLPLDRIQMVYKVQVTPSSRYSV